MNLAFVDPLDSLYTAVDGETGIEIRRQGRADIGEFPLLIVDRARPPESILKTPQVNVRPLIQVCDSPLPNDPSYRERKDIGYEISEARLSASLHIYILEDKNRLEYFKKLIEAYLRLLFSCHHSYEPIVRFAPK